MIGGIQLSAFFLVNGCCIMVGLFKVNVNRPINNQEDICLAYLLWALVKAGKTKPSVKYMTFHRAIESFARCTFGHDVPQKRYGEIKEMSLTGQQRGKSYKKAKQLIDYWTEYFMTCG